MLAVKSIEKRRWIPNPSPSLPAEEIECRWNLFSFIIDPVQIPIYSHDPSQVVLILANNYPLIKGIS